MATPQTAPEPAGFPLRYRVVAFVTSLAALTYLDRVCISVFTKDIMRDFNLTSVQMSYVFSAFTAAYAIFEIPTAWWADRIGSRRVVARIVAWWSVFTMATGAAFSYVSLLAVRFLFGVGEAGAWPNAAGVFSRWVPAGERGKVQGIFFAGAHLSGGLTPLAVTALALFLPWRWVFVLCGLLGMVWSIAWFRWFRDEPADHPSISAEETKKILRERSVLAGHGGPHGSLKKVFAHPSLIPICLMYVANTYGFYFFITWFPTYLEKGRGFGRGELAIFAGLPLTLSVVADLCGGWTTDTLTRRFGVRWGRCLVGSAGYLVATVTIVGAALTSHGYLAAALIAIGGAASMFTLAPSWATCIDIGRNHSGVLGAVMNTSGQIGGFFSPIIFANLVDKYKDWSLPLYVLAGLYGIASVAWLLIRPDKPIE